MPRTSTSVLAIASIVVGPIMLSACGDAAAGEDAEEGGIPVLDSGVSPPNSGLAGGDATAASNDAGTPSAAVNPALLEQQHARPLGVGAQPIEFAWPSQVNGDVEITELPDGSLTLRDTPVPVGTRLSPEDLSTALYENGAREPGAAGALRLSYRSPNDSVVNMSVSVDLFVHRCDELAAAVLDPDRYAEGVHLVDWPGSGQPNVLEPRNALPHCEEAHSDFPDVPRFMLQLSRCHWVLENFGKAFELAQMAMDLGSTKAIAAVANYYRDGTVVARDLDRAFELFSEAAERGDPSAQHRLHLMLSRGEGTPMDEAAAIVPLTASAEYGFHWAQYDLGMVYRDGRGTPVDWDAARHWFERSAAQNTGAAMQQLGLIYMRGNGVSVDGKTAEEYFLEAAMQDLPWPWYFLGVLYRNGSVGVDGDRDRAIDAFERAAAAGVQEAEAALDALR